LPQGYTSAIQAATWPSSFLLAPLFWIYVFVLTSQGQEWPAKLSRHFLLPGAIVVLAMLVLASPVSVRDALFLGGAELATSAAGF